MMQRDLNEKVISYILKQSTLYNYADGNSVRHICEEEKELIACLENDLSNLVSWSKKKSV